MVLVPTGMRYTATMTGSVVKPVRCENCGTEYVYLMERKVTGEGASVLFLDNKGAAQRAQQQAQTRLKATLSRESDLAPCPDCGWLQRRMIRRVKKNRIFIAVITWIVIALVGLMAAGMQHSRMGEFPAWYLVFLPVSLFAAAAFIGYTALKDFNANAQPQDRPNIMRRADYEAAMAMAQQEADQAPAAPNPHIPIPPPVHQGDPALRALQDGL